MQYTKPFQKAEYDRRIAKTKQSMADKGFDLIICQDPANMNWLTGFDGWSFYTPQAVLLHLEEDAPIWFGRPQDAKAAHITTDIPPENVTTFSETLIHHPTEHPDGHGRGRCSNGHPIPHRSADSPNPAVQ